MKSKKKLVGILLAGVLVLVLSVSIFTGCDATPVPTIEPAAVPVKAPTTSANEETNGVTTAGKYAKYVTPLPIEPGPIHGPWIDLQGENYENANCRFIYRFITKPVDMVPFPHSHDFEEFMMFFGSDPQDISDFNAEIECYIGQGEDQERYVITSPTVLFFPKGMPHCPLNFKKVDKTITMVIIALTPRYDVPHEGH